MSLIFFFILVILVVRSANERMPEIRKLIQLAETMPRDGMKPPVDRCNEMKQELDITWEAWEPQNDEESNFVPPKLRTHFKTQFFGPMVMEVGGDQVMIYDMWLDYLNISLENCRLFQTVISLKPPELRLPPFILRPKLGGYIDDLSTSTTVKTNTALDLLFSLESLTPHRVKALFQSELGTEVLVPFLVDQKWTVEWNGDRLIIYELNRLIDPRQIAEVALEATEFFELLKSGPEVIDQMMKEFFDAATSAR